MSDINADVNQGSTQDAGAAPVVVQPVAAAIDGAAAPATVPPAAAPTVPVPEAAASTQTTADSEQIALLRKIDSDIGALSAKVDESQKLAVRNGAIAGGVSGAVSGGIVALGLQFVRHKLGF